ncbi:hypothetical protein M409DRAFT_53392 [Zasmidium cellare ATCC 36951]|uniref:Uncharacterized protein n=1 Tax=Zasmidium cellare ATCC 36951 TaxID=1080233 RepID=A0A6A6CQL7_ZASCE|nr:uncharacterized protein M409DRAFT_53392 [Zasmidium cellare ATCC 36951]KAF2168069.1 hypothetical protein M409DRAFT_53392 [Zasmidium cellare ATCC 36951]
MGQQRVWTIVPVTEKPALLASDCSLTTHRGGSARHNRCLMNVLITSSDDAAIGDGQASESWWVCFGARRQWQARRERLRCRCDTHSSSFAMALHVPVLLRKVRCKCRFITDQRTPWKRRLFGSFCGGGVHGALSKEQRCLFARSSRYRSDSRCFRRKSRRARRRVVVHPRHDRVQQQAKSGGEKLFVGTRDEKSCRRGGSVVCELPSDPTVDSARMMNACVDERRGRSAVNAIVPGTFLGPAPANGRAVPDGFAFQK